MDFFRWRRTLLRALVPACLCGLVAAWGVYALTRGERPSYRSEALLATGVMTGADKDGQYVRDLVINELEGIMNLARSFETREELATRLLATYLALDDFEPSVISRRAYVDLKAKLDPGIIQRHGRYRSEEVIYASLVAERDSLRRFGEANAKHPLIQLLYGDNELVGIEHLGRLKISRRGLSDILELSYSTVDAAWCKRVLDTHLEIFLASHGAVKEERSDGALAYFRSSTADARQKLEAAEERLRAYASSNRIINYYEQTRAIAAQKSQTDNTHTEEEMRYAAALESITALETRLSKRVDLVRLNQLLDDRRREIGDLSREQVRLEIMAADSSASAPKALMTVKTRLANLRQALSRDVVSLQAVHQGPEGLELGRLLGEWLAATITREEARGKLQVLERRRRDFGEIYTDLASQGTTLKKIEREVHIAEEDYLANLQSLNEAIQREHSQASGSDLRLVDEPVLPTNPVKSKRTMLVAAGLLAGGIFPLILAIALELLSGALLSFAEAERRSGLKVVGGVARWSWLRRVFHDRYRSGLQRTSADLLWQGIRSRGAHDPQTGQPYLIALASLRPGAGKSHVAQLLAERLAARGLDVCVVGERPEDFDASTGFALARVQGSGEASLSAEPWSLCGLSQTRWRSFQVVLWELPAVATGRFSVEVARRTDNLLLIHPPAEGWRGTHDTGVALLTQASGKPALLVLNGIPADVLLNEWGASWGDLRRWVSPESTAERAEPTTGSPGAPLHARAVPQAPPVPQQAAPPRGPVLAQAPPAQSEPQTDAGLAQALAADPLTAAFAKTLAQAGDARVELARGLAPEPTTPPIFARAPAPPPAPDDWELALDAASVAAPSPATRGLAWEEGLAD